MNFLGSANNSEISFLNPMPSTLDNLQKRVRNSVWLKMIMVGILMLILLIPSSMIRNLVNERQYRREGVVGEVSGKWGTSQIIIGPILTVPYEKTLPAEDGRTRTVLANAYFLPETYDVSGMVEPEIRQRGIYDVLLYRSDLTLTGSFSRPDLSSWNVPNEKVRWNEAKVLLGVSDLRGVRENITLQWNGGGRA